MQRYFEFIIYRSVAEVRADVSRVLLGVAWWLVEPVLYLGVFYVVFALIFRQSSEDFVPLLLCGLVIWKWFASAIISSTSSISRNKPLINQVYLPKFVFPAVSVVTSTFRFLIVFTILSVFLIAYGIPVTNAWLIDLPLLIIVQFWFILGVAMSLSAIAPFIPDVRFLVENAMLLLFFMSGIFFKFQSIPEPLQPYFDLNPLAVLVRSYREILVYGNAIEWSDLLYLLFATLFLVMLGLFLLARYDRVYAKRVFV